MKETHLVIILIVFVAVACTQAKENEVDSKSEDSVEWVDLNDLTINTSPLSDLSEEQKLKVQQIYELFKEVNPNNLEGWIEGFERDLNPESEIDIWLNMGQAYSDFTESKQLTLDQKMETYNIVLMRSLMSAEEVIEKHENVFLSDQDVTQILKSYAANPEPLNIIEL